MRTRLMIRYVLGEMIPTFVLGVLVFILVLLMLQALRLTEFVLIHGVKLTAILEMMSYMSISFLPLLFPMSLLFSVLLTYGRLSADSEVVAFRAIGLSMTSIMAPALILSLLIGLLSLQTSFHIAPWGNRQFEVLFTKIGSAKPAAAIKEGTFSEGFFDLVVYANRVDSKQGKLNHVFIYDERDPDAPLTVIAKEGQLNQGSTKEERNASLRLKDGSIHRTSAGRHTKIDFSRYEIFFSDRIREHHRNKSPQSLTLTELRSLIDSSQTLTEQRLELQTELHKRTALAFACILFALLGVGLGTVTNRRHAKSSGAVICLGLIVLYWIIYVASENAARKALLPPFVAMWLANLVFAIASVIALRRSWN